MSVVMSRDETTRRPGSATTSASAGMEEEKRVSTATEEDTCYCDERCVGDQEDAFGWQPQVDPATNALCYVHSYTGEVRWPTVAPLDCNSSSMGSTEFARQGFNGSRYQSQPGIVMLPMGVMPMQSTCFELESWKGGYARYPLHQTSRAVLEAYDLPEDEVEHVLHQQHRILPSTWKMSPYGPPFLEPFPVAIVVPIPILEHPVHDGYSYAEESWQQEYHQVPSEPAQTPHIFVPPPFMSPPQAAIAPHQFAPIAPEYPVRTTGPTELPRRQIAKAHNRRGYELRQARKLMKEMGLQVTKPKNSSSASSARARLPSPPDHSEEATSTLANHLQRMNISSAAIRAH